MVALQDVSLTLKPSSVIRTLDVVTRDLKLKLKITLCERYARDDKECFCESFKLKACQTFIDFWDDDVVIPSVRILHRQNQAILNHALQHQVSL